MAAWSERAGSNIENVDPRLRDIMENAAVVFAKENPGYSVIGISGKKGRKSGTKQHPAGWAVDVDIVDKTGKHLGNFRDAKSLRTYEKFGQLARAYQKGNYPELTRDFRAGMYFGGGWWGDQMHFDINPNMKGAMSFGSWEDGLNKAGVKAYNRHNKTNMNKDELSIGMSAFPPAPSGQTGWPTQAETGPGIYGAINPATRAQQYAAAGNRRAYEQGFRPAPAATPQDFNQAIPGRYTPASVATAAPMVNAPIASQLASPSEALRIGTPSVPSLGAAMPFSPAGSYATAVAPQAAAPTQARIGTPTAPAMNISANAPLASQLASPSEALRVGAPSVPSLAPSTPFSPAGPYATAAMPAAAQVQSALPQAAPVPTARPQQAAPAPAPAAAPSAYPDESRFAMKPGMTLAQKEQIGLTQPPAPALPAPTEVPTQKVAAVQPAEEVTTTPVRTMTAPVTTIAPAAPPPEKPGGLIGALANIAGPVPNPPSRNIGTGSAAISGILGGLGQPGDTAYSRSTPGYSVKSLGNGMVEKTNQFGHKSYEHVGTPGSGMFSGQPTTGGLLSNFGMPGLGATAGGLLSGRNLGGFAGSLLGGAIAGPFGALAGGWLGNKFGGNLGGTGFGNTANVGPHAFGYAGPWGAGTAPAASHSVSGGGGLFGGWGGGGGGGLFGGWGGGGGSKKSGSSKSDSQKTDRADAAGYR